jgi:hypothetical protein
VQLPDDKPDYTLDSILKSILISRGAPREKYSTSPHEIKITFPPLSPKQQDDISLIEDSIESIKRHIIRLTSEEFEQEQKNKNSKYHDLRMQLFKDISKAIRSGLLWHPLISEFTFTHKGLGNKEILRQAKRGLEKGVKRSLITQAIKLFPLSSTEAPTN